MKSNWTTPSKISINHFKDVAYNAQPRNVIRSELIRNFYQDFIPNIIQWLILTVSQGGYCPWYLILLQQNLKQETYPIRLWAGRYLSWAAAGIYIRHPVRTQDPGSGGSASVFEYNRTISYLRRPIISCRFLQRAKITICKSDISEPRINNLQ